ncbi:MAG: CoB--CoM heterodisulfide reductase iron-sulfur subunit A family protein, partial [Bacteroidota bacterium]
QMKKRIGVYICHCGGNISDYVDTTAVKEAVETEEGVHLAKETMFACADSTQKEIVQDIHEQKLDGLVIASCSPKLHLYTFRNVAERGGLNPYNYVQTDIREQCSWSHNNKPVQATIKAIRLVRAAIERVKHSEALSPYEITAKNAVLVIGAGVSGMRAAINLADMGSEVFLIEKNFFVGGHTTQMDKLFSTDETGKELVKNLYYKVKNRPRIQLFTGAELKKIQGTIGNFNASVSIKPRYVKAGSDSEILIKATEEYEEQKVPDAFNFNLTNRKALYLDYDGAHPNIPVIDKAHFNPSEKFLKKYGAFLDLNQKEETLNLNIGAIMATTGFDPYEPKKGEYGYGESDKVITLQQLKRLIELNDKKLIYHGQTIKNIAYIYCVGSRQKDGPNKYCSRYCCTGAIHSSLQLRKKFDNINTYHLYRDIRTYGKQELLYEESSLNGDIYCKFAVDDPPVVEINNNQPRITYHDLLFDNEAFEIEPDLLVLVTGMIPRSDSHQVTNVLKIPAGSDHFFNEVHPKLRPVETTIDGIYIAGTCQGPKNITESMNSALSATAKANALVNSGKISMEPMVITINPHTCEWCEKCLNACPYNAISQSETDEGKIIATVNPAVCKGCGACAPVCPKDAIDIVGYTNDQIYSSINGLIQEVNYEP